ncbi:hypothetical protein HDU93_005971, partial [Gonapodya sp. JEL0774]
MPKLTSEDDGDAGDTRRKSAVTAGLFSWVDKEDVMEKAGAPVGLEGTSNAAVGEVEEKEEQRADPPVEPTPPVTPKRKPGRPSTGATPKLQSVPVETEVEGGEQFQTASFEAEHDTVPVSANTSGELSAPEEETTGRPKRGFPESSGNVSGRRATIAAPKEGQSTFVEPVGRGRKSLPAKHLTLPPTKAPDGQAEEKESEVESNGLLDPTAENVATDTEDQTAVDPAA